MYISGSATFGARQTDPIEMIPLIGYCRGWSRVPISILGIVTKYWSGAVIELVNKHDYPRTEMFAEKSPADVK